MSSSVTRPTMIPRDDTRIGSVFGKVIHIISTMGVIHSQRSRTGLRFRLDSAASDHQSKTDYRRTKRQPAIMPSSSTSLYTVQSGVTVRKTGNAFFRVFHVGLGCEDKRCTCGFGHRSKQIGTHTWNGKERMHAGASPGQHALLLEK